MTIPQSEQIVKVSSRDSENAAQLLFVEQGFDAASMDEVADRAGFTKRTVYSYFTGKEDLYAAVLARALSSLNDRFEAASADTPDGLEGIRAIGYAFIRFGETNPEANAVLSCTQGRLADPETAPRMQSLIRETQREMEIMGRQIVRGTADGSLRKTLDPMLTSVYLSVFSMAMLSATTGSMAGMLSQFGITPAIFIEKGMEFFSFAMQNPEKQ